MRKNEKHFMSLTGLTRKQPLLDLGPEKGVKKGGEIKKKGKEKNFSIIKKDASITISEHRKLQRRRKNLNKKKNTLRKSMLCEREPTSFVIKIFLGLVKELLKTWLKLCWQTLP